MKGHFPARTHKPVGITVQSFEPWICGKSRLCFAIFPFVFKRGPKANLQLSYVGSLLQSGMQLYVLCHQGSFSMRGFFLCCSLCMVQGLPAKLNPPQQFAQTEVHSRNRGGKEALLGAENAAVVVLSLCLSPWLKTTRF